jgi:uncharacterized oligopeptide transporter (OPT) family protein
MTDQDIHKDEAISQITGSVDEADRATDENEDPDRELSYEEIQGKWYREVYQGDKVPQLTLRAVIMGGILGSLMSVSNLYTTIKLGWAFGVAITACVLSFVIWRGFRLVIPGLSQMTILENNCMQSTASAAGYSTGTTIATAFGAYLLITGKQIGWEIVSIWTLVTALVGVLLAVPMKRQMINKEQLKFPSGLAAAETLKSLYGGSKEAVYQAYSLVGALVVGAVTGIASKGEWAWQKAIGFKLPELIPFTFQVGGMSMANFRGFGYEPSLLLMAAGMIVGMRVSLSMLLGACILYMGFGPWLVNNGIIPNGNKIISGWALWTGSGILVASGLTAFALQWKTIVRTFSSVGKLKSDGTVDSTAADMESVEVPTKWFLIGMVPLTIILAILEYVAFNISIPLGIFSVVMSFFLALVASRSTGETDITPTGAMGKIAQLTFAFLSPKDITINLMAASVTANTAIASADLLTDLKSGYLLGANARKQFFAQVVGVFFGTAAIVPAWYLMIPNKEVLESYNPPATNLYKAVAEALSNGIQSLPISAQYGLMIGMGIGCVLACLDHFFPKSKRFTPSAMGLGLSWVMYFNAAFGFALGAILAWTWKKIHSKSADSYTIPVASGAIAGESLACAFIAIMNALEALKVTK